MSAHSGQHQHDHSGHSHHAHAGHDHDHDHDHDDHAGNDRSHAGHSGHSHAGHSHGGLGHAHGAGATATRLGLAALVSLVCMIAEIAGGFISGSLALLADAGHMFADFAALVMAFAGARLALRPADWKRSYGFDRFSVLVAFVSGLSLFVLCGIIVFAAIGRFFSPVEVMGTPMLVIAGIGLLGNVVSFLILNGAERDLNVRGAILHVLGDLLGSVAAIGAALVIMFTGWTPIDPILSVLVALLILRSATQLVREAGAILLEAAPEALDSRAISTDLAAHVPGVSDVHHMHVWSINEARTVATLHARIAPDAQPEAVVAAIKQRLGQKFGIGHVTVEAERGACADTTTAPCADAA